MVTTFIDFYGRRADGHVVHATVPQFDGSRYASGNCAAASEAVRDRVEGAARVVRGSPWPPTGASIRQGTGDTSGGLTPYQTCAVSWEHYRITADIRVVDWSVAIKKLRERYAMTILICYRPIAEAGESASPGFYGGHSVSLLGVRGEGSAIEVLLSDPLRDGRRAGIPEGPVWISLSVIRRAAASLDLGGGTTVRERYGPNKVYASFGINAYEEPVPPPLPGVTLRFGATKFRKPRRVRVIHERTNLRESPRKRSRNVARLVPRGWRFDAYQHVENADGRWLGNKAGTRWLFRPGVKFVKYL